MEVSIEQAIRFLTEGHVVAVPTETVYGLAARLDDSEAVKHIFRLKGRPSDNPLIIHLSDVSQIKSYAEDLPMHFESLASTFWPGAMTLVLPIKKEMISPLVRAHLSTAAFRVPNHPLTLEVIKKAGPLVMPSANLSGSPSSTRREHVEADFGLEFPVLDGGPSFDGVESTILIFREGHWEIIRLGAIPAEDFLPVLGYCPKVVGLGIGSAPICPGQLHRHYAPKAKLFLAKNFPHQYQGVIIGFSDRKYPNDSRIISLGAISNPELAANNLYSILRRLDNEGIETAYVDVDFPHDGLWATILERLTKAATKK